MFKKVLVTTLLASAFALSAQASKGGKDHPLPEACKGDVATVCPGVAKGEGRIWKCLKENESKLSTGCTTAMTEAKEKMKEKMTSMKEACGADKDKFCSDVKMGRGRIMKCLKRHESELSQECKDEMAQAKADWDTKKTTK